MTSTTADAQTPLSERKKSNLAFSFMALEPERRDAMAVFYDFCREVDDIVDNTDRSDAIKASQLETWSDALRAIYQQTTVPDFAQPMQGVIQRFAITQQPILDIIDGVAMDIGNHQFETFQDLQKYCYGVASAVGLVCIQIFGCTHPQTQAYAENLGYALQLTNILRDVVEDYHEMERIYLPQQELRAFGVANADLYEPARNPNCKRLFRLCYYRCKHFFNKARRLLPTCERKNLKAALIMAAFYEDILEKIKAHDFNLTPQRLRLSKPRKLHLLWRTLKSLERPLAPRHPPGKVAVIGGGVAGMTAALNLGLEGFTPQLYEAKAYLGGRAHSLTDAPTGLTLDNGQHIVMGCYQHFMQLVDILGIEHKFSKQDTMTVPYVSPGQRWSQLKAMKLPAPFHLICGLFNFNELSTRDRLAIMRMGSTLRLHGPPPPTTTVAAWLEHNGQTPGSIRALWEPFCIAALNEPIATASARLLYATLQQSLFGKSNDATILLSKVGLSDLFYPEIQYFLQSIGGDLKLQHQIKHIHYADTKVEYIETAKGDHIQADCFISALPWPALAALLPQHHPLRNQVSAITSSAILSIHILCEQKLFASQSTFVGLLDSPVHWVFDRTQTLPESFRGQHLYAIVISAANDWMHKKSDTIIEDIKMELNRFFPNAQDLSINRHLVYKSKNATFAACPENESLRPTPDTPWDNFLLAGDWIQTGIPATLEGAAQSGFEVVRALDAQQE